MYIEPPEIWLDPRVLVSMKTAPDLDSPEGVESVLYISQERVREITRAATGGAEFFIQVAEVNNSAGKFVGLTNYGRIYHYSFATKSWSIEIKPPVFDEAPDK